MGDSVVGEEFGQRHGRVCKGDRFYWIRDEFGPLNQFPLVERHFLSEFSLILKVVFY